MFLKCTPKAVLLEMQDGLRIFVFKEESNTMSKRNNPIDIREEIRLAKLDLELLQEVPCTKQENREYLRMVNEGMPLPHGVYRYTTEDDVPLDEFYAVYDPQLTEKEQQEYLSLLQTQELQTIRKCVVFFTVLTIVGLLLFGVPFLLSLF